MPGISGELLRLTGLRGSRSEAERVGIGMVTERKEMRESQ